MIDTLLPPSVSACEAFEDVLDHSLFPEEEAHIAASVLGRRREFTTVRACAAQALAGIGVAPVPLLPGQRGAPGWPPNVVGSMTHCTGYRATAVAHARDVLTLGVDAEQNLPLPNRDVLDAITLPEERAMIAVLTERRPEVCWDRLVFSAKESVYKAWFPLTRRWLDFDEAEIRVQGTGTFTARLRVAGPVADGAPLTGFDGRWLARDGLLVTAIAVCRTARAGQGRTQNPENVERSVR